MHRLGPAAVDVGVVLESPDRTSRQVKDITGRVNDQYQREGEKLNTHRVGYILSNLGLAKRLQPITRRYAV